MLSPYFEALNDLPGQNNFLCTYTQPSVHFCKNGAVINTNNPFTAAHHTGTVQVLPMLSLP